MSGWCKNTFVFWSEVYSCTAHQPQETKESESVSLARTQIFLSNLHKSFIKCKQIFSLKWHKSFLNLNFFSNSHKYFYQTQTISYLQTHTNLFVKFIQILFCKTHTYFKIMQNMYIWGPPKRLEGHPHSLSGCPGSFWIPSDPSEVTNRCITHQYTVCQNSAE